MTPNIMTAVINFDGHMVSDLTCPVKQIVARTLPQKYFIARALSALFAVL
jgi:hypothetical protein